MTPTQPIGRALGLPARLVSRAELWRMESPRRPPASWSLATIAICGVGIVAWAAISVALGYGAAMALLPGDPL